MILTCKSAFQLQCLYYSKIHGCIIGRFLVVAASKSFITQGATQPQKGKTVWTVCHLLESAGLLLNLVLFAKFRSRSHNRLRRTFILTFRPEPPPLLLSPIHAPKLVFPPTTSPSMMEGKVSPPPPSSPPTIQLPTSGASSSMPVIIPPGAGQLLNTYQAYISMLGQPPPPQNRAFTPLKEKGKHFLRNPTRIWNN